MNEKTTYTLILTAEQMEFLRQVLNTDTLAVPVKLAKVAGEVYSIVMTVGNQLES